MKKDAKYIEWLYRQLPELTKLGVLSPESEALLHRHYGEVNPRSPASLVLSIFGVIGALCIGLGIVSERIASRGVAAAATGGVDPVDSVFTDRVLEHPAATIKNRRRAFFTGTLSIGERCLNITIKGKRIKENMSKAW